MSLKAFSKKIDRIENLVKNGAILSPSLFDAIPVDVMGLLYLYYIDEYPNLKALLPELPLAEVQRQWTGADGLHLWCKAVRLRKPW
jgi:hypothetical protein